MGGPAGLRERGKSLTDSFFVGEAEGLMDPARLLAEGAGIEDQDLLERLQALGIRAETLQAFALVPLVQVAWADGRMEDAEREAVLDGAASTGIEPESLAYNLLRLWTYDPPPPELEDVWGEFIAVLTAELDDDQRRRLRKRIVGRARAVAEAAGGFLGLGSPVSASEEAVLARLDRAFG